MFGDVAIQLLKLMGHSGTVPSAILPEDIPVALQRLRAALDAEETSTPDAISIDEDGEFGDTPVGLRTRAFPLMELLEAAAREEVPVRWEA